MQTSLLYQENAQACLVALDQLFRAVPMPQRKSLMPQFNGISLFLEQAKKDLPTNNYVSDIPSKLNGFKGTNEP